MLRLLDPALLLGHVVAIPIRLAKACFRRAIIRINLESLFENSLGAVKRFALSSEPEITHALHKILIRLGQSCGVGAESLPLLSAQVDFQRVGDAAGEFVFDGEQVRNRSGNGVGGEVLVGFGVDQTIGSADKVAILLQRNREAQIDAEFFFRISQRGDFLIFERARRNDLDIVVRAQLRKFGGYVFKQAFAEGGELGIVGDGGNGQNGEAFVLGNSEAGCNAGKSA